MVGETLPLKLVSGLGGVSVGKGFGRQGARVGWQGRDVFGFLDSSFAGVYSASEQDSAQGTYSE
jgi:hypothetical protein